MVIKVRVFSGMAARKKPKSGDEKTLKDGTVKIRQQVRHGPYLVVSNGRPVYEWVVKGSADDRKAAAGNSREPTPVESETSTNARHQQQK